MEPVHFTIIGFVLGFLMDQLFGDPQKLPHPIVGFGNMIAFGEKHLNNGNRRLVKGAILTITLVLITFAFSSITMGYIAIYSDTFNVLLTAIVVFYCLSARTLRKEVQMVFEAVDRSTEDGRKQLSRIVGRDTTNLEPQQIRSAALETLAENLSDGVIAPLFWFAIFGIPGILTYKMINTFDSMIGYKNERYLLFGRFAAKLDDVANFIPARITAFIMLLVANRFSMINFVLKNGKNHASPNSGYPESALAAILNCQFGGPNYYFGKIVEKPFIGSIKKIFSTNDMKIALRVNYLSEYVMMIVVLISMYCFYILKNSTYVL